MLSITKFEKRYQDTLILKIDNLELRHGIYWIKGENGSGKSTLFKSIAGLIPFHGTIKLGDTGCVTHPVAYRSMINFAEAEPLYPDFLTAKDLIRFVGKTKQATEKQMVALVEYFGVDKFYEKSCGTFSSGMLKKLSLTLAFLGNPKLIILDEPLITLDEHTRTRLIELIREQWMKGVMFLLSSHQLIDPNLELSGVFLIEKNSLHSA